MKKLPYFDAEWSIAACGSDIKSHLSVVAGRYLGANPPVTFHVRAVSTDQFIQDAGGAWNIDLSEKLGSGADGYAVVSGALMSGINKKIDIGISCFSPVQLYLNGEEIFHSTFVDEINRNLGHTLETVLKPGRNMITILCRRTAAGFGCRISLPQTTILSPVSGREGQAGWAWSDLLERRPSEIPNPASLEQDGSILWNPRGERGNEGAAGGIIEPAGQTGRTDSCDLTPQQRIFPEGGGICIAWCKVSKKGGSDRHELVIDSRGPNEVYLAGQLAAVCEMGRYRIPVSSDEPADLYIKSICEGETYGAVVTAEGCKLLPPGTINGTDEVWVYTGLFDPDQELPNVETTGLFGMPGLLEMPGGKRWYLDEEKLCLRTFFEGSYGDRDWVSQGGSAFGRWDYPLGVTLFGLLRTAVTLGREDMLQYVTSHISSCASLYESAAADKAINGSPAYDQNLVRMDCLDDCGSMGLAMLECYKIRPDKRYLDIAARIRDFIVNKLTKLEDGTFYRQSHNSNATSTIWADDLYMSTPFLRCLYDITGDKEALKLAAGQFLKFAKYLFLPDQGIFSHVYDLDRNIATGIPWGRGNGWVLFSLAYFLDGLTADLEQKDELMKLFLTLSASYKGLQGDKGLWHQVLTDPTSYEEASCTSMFIYGFCKGIKNGWYGEETPLYVEAVKKGYQGLTEYCVDRDGSVHAVCKGSGFSFTKEYYRDELYWVTNDNHGIGILLLAGNEILSCGE